MAFTLNLDSLIFYLKAGKALLGSQVKYKGFFFFFFFDSFLNVAGYSGNFGVADLRNVSWEKKREVLLCCFLDCSVRSDFEKSFVSLQYIFKCIRSN